MSITSKAATPALVTTVLIASLVAPSASASSMPANVGAPTGETSPLGNVVAAGGGATRSAGIGAHKSLAPVRVRGAKLVDGGRLLRARVKWSPWLTDKPGRGDTSHLGLVAFNVDGGAATRVKVPSGPTTDTRWRLVTKRIPSRKARRVAVADTVILSASQGYDRPRDDDDASDTSLVTTIALRESPRSDGVELRDCRNLPLQHDQDLHNCDFRGLRPGTTRGIVLDGADLTDASLERAKIRGLHAWRATLVRTQMQYANLFSVVPETPTNFLMADMTGANLLEMEVNWKYVNFGSAYLDGATWFDGRVCAEGSRGWCL